MYFVIHEGFSSIIKVKMEFVTIQNLSGFFFETPELASEQLIILLKLFIPGWTRKRQVIMPCVAFLGMYCTKCTVISASDKW